MQLKLRHLLLFILASAVLIYSHTPGGALLAVGVLMQLSLLIHGLELTRRSQLAALKLFLVSIPLLLFWGGIHSFVTIYFGEGQLFFFITAFVVTMALSFLLSLQIVFSYWFLKQNNYEILATLQDAFNNIKNRKHDFLKITLLLFAFSFVPWLTADWKLVFAVTATHLYVNRTLLKKALSSF